jgi:hypothetical protein
VAKVVTLISAGIPPLIKVPIAARRSRTAPTVEAMNVSIPLSMNRGLICIGDAHVVLNDYSSEGGGGFQCCKTNGQVMVSGAP